VVHHVGDPIVAVDHLDRLGDDVDRFALLVAQRLVTKARRFVAELRQRVESVESSLGEKLAQPKRNGAVARVRQRQRCAFVAQQRRRRSQLVIAHAIDKPRVILEHDVWRERVAHHIDDARRALLCCVVNQRPLFACHVWSK